MASSSLLSKALLYLGLVDETPPSNEADHLAAHDQGTTPVSNSNIPGVRIDPPVNNSRVTALRPGMGGVSAIPNVNVQADVLVVEEFGDTKVLADRIRDRVPVVLDLRVADKHLWQRTIDFSAGLVYALDGTMSKVGEGLVLVLPPGVQLSELEKHRLAGLGVYDRTPA